MGTQNYCVLSGQAADQIPDLNNLLRIETYHRFIQDNNFRESENCLSQPHTLTVAL